MVESPYRFTQSLFVLLFRILAVAGGVAVAPPSHAQPVATAAPSNAPANHAGSPRPVRPAWNLVHASDPVTGRVLHEALNRAWVYLGQPRCRTILVHFTNRDGRPLTERLAVFGVDLQTYSTMVVFIDGSSERTCAGGPVAFTTPGSRVVRVCAEALKRNWQLESSHTVAVLIHELLHTLGLGENPPASKEITKHVLDRCVR